MNNDERLGWMALSARLCAASALAAMLAIGCEDGQGGSGGSGGTTGGSGGTTSTGGTGGTGGTTGGSGGSALPTCESVLTSTYNVTMGIRETGKPWTPPDPGGPPSTLSVSGTVTDTGNGPIPEDCGYTPAGAEGAWLSVVDANGKSWTACYAGPDASMPVVAGDAVDLTFDTAWGGLGIPSFALTVRKQTELVLLAFEETFGNLTLPPEISVTDGEEVCITNGNFTCTTHGYRAVVSASDEQADVLPGGTVMVGGYDVHVGRWDTVADGGGCDAGSTEHYLFAVPAAAP